MIVIWIIHLLIKILSIYFVIVQCLQYLQYFFFYVFYSIIFCFLVHRRGWYGGANVSGRRHEIFRTDYPIKTWTKLVCSSSFETLRYRINSVLGIYLTHIHAHISICRWVYYCYYVITYWPFLVSYFFFRFNIFI